MSTTTSGFVPALTMDAVIREAPVGQPQTSQHPRQRMLDALHDVLSAHALRYSQHATNPDAVPVEFGQPHGQWHVRIDPDDPLRDVRLTKRDPKQNLAEIAAWLPAEQLIPSYEGDRVPYCKRATVLVSFAVPAFHKSQTTSQTPNPVIHGVDEDSDMGYELTGLELLAESAPDEIVKVDTTVIGPSTRKESITSSVTTSLPGELEKKLSLKALSTRVIYQRPPPATIPLNGGHLAFLLLESSEGQVFTDELLAGKDEGAKQSMKEQFHTLIKTVREQKKVLAYSRDPRDVVWTLGKKNANRTSGCYFRSFMHWKLEKDISKLNEERLNTDDLWHDWKFDCEGYDDDNDGIQLGWITARPAME